MPDTETVTVNLADIDEVSALIKASVGLDRAVVEFGWEDPQAIREVYQRFHDALAALAIASAAKAVVRARQG